jgi:hypothetical protein
VRLDPEIVQVGAAKHDAGVRRRGSKPHAAMHSRVQANAFSFDCGPNGRLVRHVEE